MSAFPADRPPILFLHIGWAREYRGQPNDPVQGKFGYFDENDDPGEASNFKKTDGRCYGYAAHWTLALKKLGGSKGDLSHNGILVIWTATSPEGDGRFIVGWYRNATAYANMQENGPGESRSDYIATAAAKDCHLVPEEDRSFFVPSMQSGWPGMARAWYADEHLNDQQLEMLWAYLDGQPSNGFLESRKPSEPLPGSASPVSPELRKRIELAAEDAVEAYYIDRGWAVERIGDQNLGWDLNVRRGARWLRVEVKGRGGRGAVELTPNEYRAMTNEKLRMSYRLAVVHLAASSPELRIFRFFPSGAEWQSETGDVLRLREKMGAIVSF